jgi:sarcosine oxidase subunit alpha
MAHRLNSGGALLDRENAVTFSFNGETLQGFEGDTLASALLANDKVLVGRSYKYHRPRGILASGAEEPNALMGIGEGPRFEPNQRATTTELFHGLTAQSQNHWPSLNFDVGGINNKIAALAPVFSAGFYYKTFMFPRAAWKHVYEPIVRNAAGLGKTPNPGDPDTYEHFHALCDVLVIGGGLAGLAAARAAAEAGAKVMLVEQTAHWGGRANTETDIDIDGQPAAEWAQAQVAALEGMENVTLRSRAMASGLYDHGYALVYERVSDHRPGQPGAPRHRLWRVRAKRTIVATGALERPLAFANNDTPGVMLAGAVRDYVRLWGVLPGHKAVVCANNDDAYRTAIALHEAGAKVAAVLDTRAQATGALPDQVRALQIPVREGHGIGKVTGAKRVTGVEIGRITGTGQMGGRAEKIACDVVAMSGGWSPVVHLYSHCGGKLVWDADQVMFRPAPARGAPTGPDGAVNTLCAGTANGHLGTPEALADAMAAGREAAEGCGLTGGGFAAPAVSEPAMAPIAAHWFTPARGKYAHGTKHFVDYQNDVTVADVRLAGREGYESVEHTKRYTTMGMATDQGKTSNINGLAILADELGSEIPDVGTTTFRPPYTPISFGAITGACRGPLFKAIRKSPMHEWSAENGADFEPVGDWQRPYCYRREGEDRHAAVTREILNARHRPARRLDAGQDRRQGSRCGQVPRPDLHQHDVEPEAGPLPLWPDVRRERLPVRRRRRGPRGRGRIPAPHHLGRLGPGARASGGMAADRVVGPEGLHSQRHRPVGAGRRCGAECAQGDRGGGHRHRRLRRGAGLHVLCRGHHRRLPGQALPDFILRRAQLRDRHPGEPWPGAVGRAAGGGRTARHHALRHRGAACDAGREGLHHDRRRDRRHGDPAGSGPRLGGVEEEGGLPWQARA